MQKKSRLLVHHSSTQRSNLKRHIRKHSGEKSFICKNFEYSSALGENLKRHTLKHSGVKYFGCKQCKLTFTRLWPSIGMSATILVKNLSSLNNVSFSAHKLAIYKGMHVNIQERNHLYAFNVIFHLLIKIT